MLQESNAVQLAVEMLTKDDFYQPFHREIYDAMLALNLQQMPVDLMTVQAELSRRGTLEGIGGNIYLVELYSFAPATANVKAASRFRRSVTVSRIPFRKRFPILKRQSLILS